ncbi:IclR family transcriptional regulator [Amycolatopsis sp. NPDC051903]|uniref:IclR family transcriptional regulator n=1 Tax=Amycolatopsis sp. NPDC051903 TaxID=3363936 RepID=UPI0037B25D8C
MTTKNISLTGEALPIASVDNALRTLTLLGEKQNLRVMDVAAYLGVARSTAHRLLTAMLQRGFVVQDARKIYRPGPAFTRLGRPGVVRPGLTELVRPSLVELSERVGETCHLGVLEGNGTRFVDCAKAPGSHRVGSRVGMLMPAHSNSIGRALLAELSPAAFQALYPRGLPAPRGSEIARRADLQRALAVVRQQGYALNFEESGPGIVAVGTCVRDDAGQAVAGIAVACASSGWTAHRLPSFVEALSLAAERVRREWGAARSEPVPGAVAG